MQEITQNMQKQTKNKTFQQTFSPDFKKLIHIFKNIKINVFQVLVNILILLLWMEHVFLQRIVGIKHLRKSLGNSGNHEGNTDMPNFLKFPRHVALKSRGNAVIPKFIKFYERQGSIHFRKFFDHFGNVIRDIQPLL